MSLSQSSVSILKEYALCSTFSIIQTSNDSYVRIFEEFVINPPQAMVTIEIFFRGEEFPRYERTYVGPAELLAADVAGILVVILRGPVKFLDGVIEL